MSDANFVAHIACPSCGSSDANAVYDDGHSYCFACNTTVQGDKREEAEQAPSGFLKGDVMPLLARKLNAETCQKFGYVVGRDRSGNVVQVANYRNKDGKLIAQKVRGANKQFTIIGDGKNLPLFGMHLWPDTGRRIVITEGEVDALSVGQAVGLKWPVCSLPNGAPAAKKAIQRNLDWLSGYEQVVLAFDTDEAGRAAAAECAPLFKPGQCAIWDIPFKDASDMLVAGQVKELAAALWNARPYRPDGIVNAKDTWEQIVKRQKPGLSYPWPSLTQMTYGQQPGSLTTWTAGSGAGKSTAVAQVAYDLAFNHGLKIGYVALEESIGRTAQRFVGMRMGKPVHLEGVATPEEMRAAFDETLGTGRVWLYQHFGSNEADDLVSKLRYLAKGCECKALILDHVSIAVSGSDLAVDERRLIDQLVTRIRTLTEETGVIFHMISHLRKSGDDRGYEEGSRVSLSQLRGSAAIGQLSDCVIGLERDLQAEGESIGTLRVIKNRLSGDTGVACRLAYDKTTGLLTETTAPKHGFQNEEKDF